MNEIEKNRLTKLINNILDFGADEILIGAKDIIHTVSQEVKNIIIKKYTNSNDGTKELKDLERLISISNENEKIGMDKKEIAVMWAMKKLGYNKEQIQEVLNLANKAYDKQ